jgi:uncharacterized coiled-coil protein SlyX
MTEPTVKNSVRITELERKVKNLEGDLDNLKLFVAEQVVTAKQQKERVDSLTHKFPTRVEVNEGWKAIYDKIDSAVEDTLPLIYKAEVERKLSAMFKQITELRMVAAEQIGKAPGNPVTEWFSGLADSVRTGVADARKTWQNATKDEEDD